MALSDHLDDRLGAGEDLLRGVDTREVAVIAVVSADQQHDHLRRLGEVEFAVLQVPQDFLGALAVHSKVNGMTWCEVAVPHGLVRRILAVVQFAQRMGDRVADQYQVVVSGLDRRDLLLVPRIAVAGREIRITRLRFGRGQGGQGQEQGANRSDLA